MLDIKVVDKYLVKYPLLENVLQGGVVTRKMTREVLDIDRWMMNDVYTDLLMAGAIRGTASSCFRATDECLEYIERRNMYRVP